MVAEKSPPEQLQGRVEQYKRLSDDWRHYNTSIWALPAIGLAIVSGTLTIAYERLAGWPRVVVLCLGSLFVFSLTLALWKHKLFMDVRAAFLAQLEEEGFGIKATPVGTTAGLAFLRSRGRKATGLLALLDEQRAWWYLMALLALGGLALLFLAVREFLT